MKTSEHQFLTFSRLGHQNLNHNIRRKKKQNNVDCTKTMCALTEKIYFIDISIERICITQDEILLVELLLLLINFVCGILSIVNCLDNLKTCCLRGFFKVTMR